MSSVGERTAGHGDALGRKFIVINLRCIHAHIVQNDAKPQTGEAWGSLGTPHLSPTEGACPWAAGGWHGLPRSMVEGNHPRAALAAQTLWAPRSQGHPARPCSGCNGGSAGQKGVPSGRWTSLQGKRPPPPGLRGVRPGWGRILRSPLPPSAPPLCSTAPQPPPDS